MASFSGNTAECVQDYGRRYNISGGLGLMAEATGVVVTTALAWVLGESMPSGDPHLKLRCYLHFVGYQVEEYEVLPKPTQRFAELIMLGVITADSAAAMLGYKNTQDLYRMLLRGTGLLPDKSHRLQRFVEENAEQREALVGELRAKFAALSIKENRVDEEPPADQSEPQGDVREMLPDLTIETPLAVQMLIQGLQMSARLLEVIDSAEGSWGEHARALLTTQVSDHELDELRRLLESP